MQTTLPAPSTRPLALWLFACAGLVFAMTLIGAITRLTGSGLSIAVWAPVSGTLPPLTPAAWEAMFRLYQETPEFRLRNAWMDLEAFKTIFFWEWFHRLFGRLIGLAYAGPLVWFWIKGRIPRGWHGRLLALLGLGFAQGALGWYMVASGLVDRPSVSHLRLAAHLGLATLIAALMLWCGLRLWGQAAASVAESARRPLALHATGTIALTALALLWGAFTAGLDAGLVHNTFPLMAGRLVPPEFGFERPLWLDLTHNPVSVQFVHRWLGVLTALTAAGFSIHAWRRGLRDRVFAWPGLAALAQAGLGIATLLSGVPIVLAVAHQGGALILLGTLIAARQRLGASQPISSSAA